MFIPNICNGTNIQIWALMSVFYSILTDICRIFWYLGKMEEYKCSKIQALFNSLKFRHLIVGHPWLPFSWQLPASDVLSWECWIRRVSLCLGGSLRCENFLRPAIRHILAEGDGRGGFFCCSASPPPHHGHTRDTHKKVQTLSCNSGI